MTTATVSNELTIPEFLSRYPWPPEYLKWGKPMEYLWRFDLPVALEKLWPHVADTSAFNQMLELSEMKFTEKNGRLYGTSTTAGIPMAWEEVPWEWEYGRSLTNTRLYSKGFLIINRAIYLLEPVGTDKTRLYVYFGVIPRGVKGKLLTKIGMPQLEKKFRKAFDIISAYIQKQQKLILSSKPIQFSPEVRGRVEEVRKGLVDSGLRAALVDKMVQFVKTGSEEELVRIRLKPLAREWNVKERELLEAFLQATRRGLFKLTWDVICPHCRGVREEVSTLGQIPKRGRCEACKIDFDATTFNALEVTFHVHPSIRQVQKRMYCAAEPAMKPHIKLQKTIRPKDELALGTLLSLGRYRLRVLGKELYNLLDVDSQYPGNQVKWADTLAQQNFKSAYFPTVVLQNTAAEPTTFVLEENQLDQDTLRPVDLFTFQDFRDLFSQEALASDIKLEVGVQTILFTDLVGSTKFYETEGDTVAFAEVRSHFLKAYDSVKQHDGAVVKTIGDAVMAAFAKPLDALKAAVELQRYFNGNNPETRLRLRVTLNTGSCLAVNLNSNIDYFGNTVNLSAKIQAVAGAGQIGFTEQVFNDTEVKKFFEESRLPVEKLDFEMKWAKKTIPVYRVEVK